MIDFFTPPLLQTNSPYPAIPVLTGFLRSRGYEVHQHDLSLELSLKMFSAETVRHAAKAARAGACADDPAVDFFLESAEDYADTVEPVVAFLQGRNPALAWRIAARTCLPEGPAFAALNMDDGEEGAEEENLQVYFGLLGTQDRAKYLASLYMDDLASFFAKIIDPDFGFGRYAEKLAVSLPSFNPLYQRLISQKSTYIDQLCDELTERALDGRKPEFAGISVPFPGTLYGAFRIARHIRELSPDTKIIMGGGYINSELRELEDKRVFQFVDFISYDEGFEPLLAILRGELQPVESSANVRVLSKEGPLAITGEHFSLSLLAPDMDGVDLHKYFSICEMPNPMHRIWTDGCWLKMQLAQGCYWHKCAFCDLNLDYICRYAPAKPVEIVDAMERLMSRTGRTGFHFVDEALSPALVRGVSEEILRRGLKPTWWGNIRFDKSYTPELVELMADAGCVAVTGGLECAHNRLLALMNKGITLESAKKTFQAFAERGILVHAYLMYAFPTETKSEAVEALDFVRQCFAENLIQSAFWHRFALTAHSPIAANPEKFGIHILPEQHKNPRFARNELRYTENNAPDWDRIGPLLTKALYNFMLGIGLDIPAKRWLQGK